MSSIESCLRSDGSIYIPKSNGTTATEPVDVPIVHHQTHERVIRF